MLDPGPFQMISAIDFPQETGTPADISVATAFKSAASPINVVLTISSSVEGLCGETWPDGRIMAYTAGYYRLRFRGTPSLPFTPTAATVCTGGTSGAVVNMSIGNPIPSITSAATVCWKGGDGPSYTDDIIVKSWRLSSTGLCQLEMYGPLASAPSPYFSLGETVTVLWS